MEDICANRKVYLHVGAHKTATTYIQNYLNSDGMHDLLYNKYKIYFDRIGPAKRRRREVRTPQLLETFGESVIYVCSDEEMIGSVDYKNLDRSRKCYDNFYDNCDILERIYGKYNPEIILYVRRQDTFVESLYSEYLRYGNILPFKDFLSDIVGTDSYDWNRYIDEYKRRGWKVNCRGYENIFIKGGNEYIKDFVRIFNKDCAEEMNADEVPARIGFTKKGLEDLRNENIRMGQHDWSHIETRDVKAIGACFDMRERREFLSLYTDANVKLFENAGVLFTELEEEEGL